MQQQYHLTFTMPLAPTPKKKQQEDEPQLPDDLAVLQTVGSCSQPQRLNPLPQPHPPAPSLLCHDCRHSAMHHHTLRSSIVDHRSSAVA